MPWKTLSSSLVLRVKRGFNSATALMPWKTKIFPTVAADLSKLQFGHGADAVENEMVGQKFGKLEVKLQFGHGADAVENLNVYTNQVGEAELLQFGHGADAVENEGHRRARSADHPGFNSATALMPWKTKDAKTGADRKAMLQFGHGADAVENFVPTSAKRIPCAGFNSATALMPWKTSSGRAISESP